MGSKGGGKMKFLKGEVKKRFPKREKTVPQRTGVNRGDAEKKLLKVGQSSRRNVLVRTKAG